MPNTSRIAALISSTVVDGCTAAKKEIQSSAWITRYPFLLVYEKWELMWARCSLEHIGVEILHDK